MESYVFTAPSHSKTTVYRATGTGRPSKAGNGWDIWSAMKKISPMAAKNRDFSVFENRVVFEWSSREDSENFKAELCVAGVCQA